MTNEHLWELNELMKNQNILLLHRYKGVGIVILNKKNYVDTIGSIFSDVH